MHLALWNLKYSNINQGYIRYFHYEEIALWINNHWELLQCPPDLQSILILNRVQHILSALQRNSKKFKSGKEVRNKSSIWKLRDIDMPPCPSDLEIILPPESPFNEGFIHKISFCQRTTELPLISKAFKVDDALLT